MRVVMSCLFFVTVFFLKAHKAVSSGTGILISAHIKDVFDDSCSHTHPPLQWTYQIVEILFLQLHFNPAAGLC